MGFGLNVQGMADGYQGFKSEQRRLADDDRRAAADAQALKDQAYQEETRNRQRYEWTESDRKRDEGRAATAKYWADHPEDAPASAAPTAQPAVATTPAAPVAESPAGPDSIVTQGVPDPAAGISAQPAAAAFAMPADVDPGAQYMTPPGPVAAPVAQAAPTAPAPAAPQQGNQAAPSQSTAAPEVAPAAAPAAAVLTQANGMPKPRKMGNTLDMYSAVLEAASRKGDVSAEGYVKTREFLDKARSEGVTQAMDAFAAGRFEDGMRFYNSNGNHTGAKLVSAVAGTTTLEGRSVPTNLVTIENADGSRATIDTTLDRYKLMSLEKQADYLAKSAQADHHRDSGKAALQNAGTNESVRKDMNRIREEENKRNAINAAETNRIRELAVNTKGAGKTDNAEIKARNEAIKLNSHLYSYLPDGAEKEVVLPAAKSLYGNMMVKLGSADQAYANMDAMKTEAMQDAADPTTGLVDQKKFLMAFNAKVADADVEMRRPRGQASTGPATKPPPGAPNSERVTLTADSKKRIENGALRDQPASKGDIPDPPPKQTGAGFSQRANPAYADWAKQYLPAYEAKQKRLAAQGAEDKKRADAYTAAPYAQPKKRD